VARGNVKAGRRTAVCPGCGRPVRKLYRVYLVKQSLLDPQPQVAGALLCRECAARVYRRYELDPWRTVVVR